MSKAVNAHAIRRGLYSILFGRLDSSESRKTDKIRSFVRAIFFVRIQSILRDKKSLSKLWQDLRSR